MEPVPTPDPSTLRILLIEDSAADARLLEEALRDVRSTRCEIMWRQRLSAGLDCLMAGGFDVVLLDLSLPDGRGLRTVERTRAAAPGLPILVLTGLDDETMALRALEAGAQDYLVKGVDGRLVVRAIRYAIERKRGEEEIRRLNAELEQRVLDRTRALAVANRELEAFNYSVAHLLRGPLQSIEGFAYALLEDHGPRLSGPGREYVRRLTRASRRLTRLVDALLDLSRITRREARRERVDVSALAREVLADLQRLEPDRRLGVQVADGIVVEGDADLLRLLLENLLDNAWKFTRRTPEARIEVGSRRQDGATVVYVRDNGAGFDMAWLDKLFSTFGRLHGPAEFESTGLGLVMVGRVVERHGGRLWAEGAVGQGATFYFQI